MKDAMVAVIGASVALAGLLLIFSGFLFSQAAGMDPSITPDKTIRAFKEAARGGLYPFAASLILAVLAVGYWLFPNHCFSIAVVVLFAILSLATVAYGFWATSRL
jgi:hypothetical protein